MALPLNYHLRESKFESTHLYHTKKLRLCLGFAYAKRLAWALIFLFFAPNVNAKAFSATFYFYSLIIPHLMLAYGKRKAMLCQGGTTLNINHSTFGSVQKVGVGGFTLKLSFKGTQIRVHSSLPQKSPKNRAFLLFHYANHHKCFCFYLSYPALNLHDYHELK